MILSSFFTSSSCFLFFQMNFFAEVSLWYHKLYHNISMARTRESSVSNSLSQVLGLSIVD